MVGGGARAEIFDSWISNRTRNCNRKKIDRLRNTVLKALMCCFVELIYADGSCYYWASLIIENIYR
jgi:hypothetical protein